MGARQDRSRVKTSSVSGVIQKLEVCQTQGASRLAHNRPKFPPGHQVPHGCGTPSTAMRSIATALRTAPVQWKRWICSRSAPEHEIHLLGCILLMVWAGLRFADAQRTCPSSLLRDRHVLREEHWRTKVSGSGQSFGALAFVFFRTSSMLGLGPCVFRCASQLALPYGEQRRTIPSHRLS